MEQTTSVQEQLLAHVLKDKDLEVYSLMSSLVAAEDNTPASTESSRSNSPTDGYVVIIIFISKDYLILKIDSRATY